MYLNKNCVYLITNGAVLVPIWSSSSLGNEFSTRSIFTSGGISTICSAAQRVPSPLFKLVVSFFCGWVMCNYPVLKTWPLPLSSRPPWATVSLNVIFLMVITRCPLMLSDVSPLVVHLAQPRATSRSSLLELSLFRLSIMTCHFALSTPLCAHPEPHILCRSRSSCMVVIFLVKSGLLV